MLTFIDISGWQRDINLDSIFPQIDALVVKATDGNDWVDTCCDKFVQKAIKNGTPWGFYHFAENHDALSEANWFYSNCTNYFHHGIPILDWEQGQSVDWVNTFVRRIHEYTGVWPWIYSTASNFNKGGVESNCMRWVAQWPSVSHPTFEQAKSWTKPSCDGLVGAWQFCSDGRLNGYSSNLDCDLFYGDKEAWYKYAGVVDDSGAGNGSDSGDADSSDVQTLENDSYKVTIERK